MGPQLTFNSPHLLPTLTFPCISLTLSPTPHPTFLHLLSYLFPHLPFLPPHPNTFSYTTLHFLKVWRSYHVAKLLATSNNTFTQVDFWTTFYTTGYFNTAVTKFAAYRAEAKPAGWRSGERHYDSCGQGQIQERCGGCILPTSHFQTCF